MGKMMEPRQCRVCGKMFMPTHSNNQLCSAECKRIRRKMTQDAWLDRNRAKKNELNKLHMRKVRGPITDGSKTDAIIGEGYAERQIASTLAKVEPIKTTL